MTYNNTWVPYSFIEYKVGPADLFSTVCREIEKWAEIRESLDNLNSCFCYSDIYRYKIKLFANEKKIKIDKIFNLREQNRQYKVDYNVMTIHGVPIKWTREVCTLIIKNNEIWISQMLYVLGGIGLNPWQTKNCSGINVISDNKFSDAMKSLYNIRSFLFSQLSKVVLGKLGESATKNNTDFVQSYTYFKNYCWVPYQIHLNNSMQFDMNHEDIINRFINAYNLSVKIIGQKNKKDNFWLINHISNDNSDTKVSKIKAIECENATFQKEIEKAHTNEKHLIKKNAALREKISVLEKRNMQLETAMLHANGDKDQKDQNEITAYEAQINELKAINEANDKKLIQAEQKTQQQNLLIEYYRSCLSRPTKKEDFPNWVSERFDGKLYLSDKAVKTLLNDNRSGVSLNSICNAIEFLALEYRSFLLGEITRQEQIDACSYKYQKKYSISKDHPEQQCNENEYTFWFNGKKYICSKHLRDGNAVNSLIRIYFVYDTKMKAIIVGSLPTHLSVKSTN